ncbi:MAG: MFS transporter [Bifidobacteriaceae bacterium]|nr:MFS transporter [Bifidobacteriaceae bacterium]
MNSNKTYTKEELKQQKIERKKAIKEERKRLSLLRRRRRLRVNDITVVEGGTLRKALIGSVVGNLMEWYDVGVYGYVAVIIGRLFLPAADSHVQNLFSLGVFAVTFIARPLGGIILGSLGDKIGRKEVLAFTLLMMAAATFLIGVLPTYAAIGVAAPILLICLKLVQGFSTGGEYAGATTFITEYAPDKHRGFYASLLDWGSYIGFAIGAAFVSFLQLTVSSEFMESFGWRIPFIVALPLGVIALVFRNRIEDTPAFVESQNQVDSGDNKPAQLSDVEEAVIYGDDTPNGVGYVIKTYWRELLVAFVLVAAANTVGYALTSYMPTYLSTTLHYDEIHGNFLTLPVLILLAFGIPLCGWISDKIGRKTVLAMGSIAAIVLVVPAFKLMEQGAIWETLLGLFLLAVPVALYMGNLASSLPAMFPTSSRYSAMGIAYNAAVAIFGGTAGFIMEALVTSTGNALSPAFWVMGTSVAGLVAVIFLKESARQPLPGSMPAVSTEEEAVELVENQEENPDINVSEIIEQVPLHIIDQVPSVEEAAAEVQVALDAEAEAKANLQKAQQVTMAAQKALIESQMRAHEEREAKQQGDAQ